MNQWLSGITSSCCSNKYNFLYGFCCPSCAIATAKSNFDNSNWIFNLCCFGLCPNHCIVRTYIRKGYDIEGDHMNDCFYGTCCISFSAIQLLNEVSTRGLRKKNIKPNNESINKYENIVKNTPMCFDSISKNIDCVCTCMNMPCETASVYSNIIGYPLWFAFLSNINICQLNHIVRQEYNIVGDELNNDIFIPIIYGYTALENIRNIYFSFILPKEKIENDEITDLLDNFHKKSTMQI